MKNLTHLTFAALGALALSACGPSAPAAAPNDPEHGHADHEAHGDHGKGHPGHANLEGATKELHDVFAPLWHMEKGAARASKTCDALPELDTLTAKVAAEPSPAKQGAAKALATKLEALEAECAKEGRPAFDEAFSTAHDALHALMEAK